MSLQFLWSSKCY